ncbi:hypothetical protein [Sagittula sp. SSi028]|uniref:hypothetical protein n=1 Tax=Sagittula sp. SSi028 TaxID=3400636 RepID=UPI003AF68BAD
MDIVKTAGDWAKAEMLSSGVFVAFGLVFIAASYGFWQYGKVDMARAFVWPTLLAGALLLILGGGLLYSAYMIGAGAEAAFATDGMGFVTSEIARVDSTVATYKTAVFKVMPGIIILCAVLLMMVQGLVLRAGLMTAIVMVASLMVVDANASARLQAYKTQLLFARDEGQL